MQLVTYLSFWHCHLGLLYLFIIISFVNKLIKKQTKLRVKNEIWIATGLRTPFAKAEKELKNVSALDMSKEVLNKM